MQEKSGRETLEKLRVQISVTQQQTSCYHRSAIDLLDELPAKRLFKTPEEADQYLQEERSSWEN
ncbi:MAG: hypothetical protein F6K31_29785 [Symploca sp. SIO2G7]|nr:hypothetical protein [Symploca sp. SIO2G7]